MPAKQRFGLGEEAGPAGSRQRAAEGSEQRSIGRLQLGSWDLAAEHAELVTQDEKFQVLGGITAGGQHEQLDRAAQRQVGKFRQHQVAFVMRGNRRHRTESRLPRTRSSEAAFDFPHPTGVWQDLTVLSETTESGVMPTSQQ
jgi:hypothetical protein